MNYSLTYAIPFLLYLYLIKSDLLILLNIIY